MLKKMFKWTTNALVLRVWGVLFLALGGLGYAPAVIWDGELFGLFGVDATRSGLYLVCGAVALLVATRGEALSSLFVKIFGVLFLALGALGFVSPDPFGLFEVGLADNILHLVIASDFLFAGFTGLIGPVPTEKEMAAATTPLSELPDEDRGRE